MNLQRMYGRVATLAKLFQLRSDERLIHRCISFMFRQASQVNMTDAVTLTYLLHIEVLLVLLKLFFTT